MMAMNPKHKYKWFRWLMIAGWGTIVIVLAVGTWRNPHFWQTADQRGDRLFLAKNYSTAAKTYADPWHIGVAQFRNGDFEMAAKTFARVPGGDGAFNQGNAWVMRGNYAAAVASYDRALDFRPGWKEAEENKALALARKQALDKSGEDREESAQAYDPDKVVLDQKKGNDQSQPQELSLEKLSDEELRATWLRRVQTTPGDFLRAKFAYQAAQLQATQPGLPETSPAKGGAE